MDKEIGGLKQEAYQERKKKLILSENENPFERKVEVVKPVGEAVKVWDDGKKVMEGMGGGFLCGRT